MRYYAGFAESFYYAYAHGRGQIDRGMIDVPSLRDCVTRKTEVQSIDWESVGLLPAPASGPGSLGPGNAGRHPLVSGHGNRHKAHGLSRHDWNSPLAQDAFALIAPGIFVSTPEFTFLQLARILSPLKLILVGCSLCASYRLDVATGSVINVPPLSSVERLSTFLAGSAGIPGVHAARRALVSVADGAESPQEVNLFLLMSLPQKLGGAGIEGLQHNYVIEPDEDDRDILDRSNRKFFRIDMGAPSLDAGMEYLGKHHDLQPDKDRERLNALTALGQKVLQAKYADIEDPQNAKRLTRQFARILGVELKALSPTESLARADLYDELFGVGRLQL